MADSNTIRIVLEEDTKLNSSSTSTTSNKTSATPPPLPKAKKQGGKGEDDVTGAVADRLGLGGVMKDAKAVGGMGAAGGAAAGAAGIVGLALMGIQQVTASMQGLAKTADKVSAGLVGMVDNKFASGSDVTNGIAEMQESLPIIGEMLGAQTRLQGAIIGLPEKLSDAFLQRAKQLGGFSGAIAGAEAIADARGEMANLREANELGPAMGRMIDAQSRLENELRELLLPIKKFVVEVLADRLETLANAAKVVANLPTVMETITDYALRAAAEAVRARITDARKILLQDLPEKLKEILKEPELDDMFNDFFRDLDNANQMGGFIV